MIRATSRSLVCLGIAGAGISAPALADRPKIDPFISIDQFTEQQLNGDGDSVTYSEVSAGVQAEFKTRRIVSTVSYRFAQRIPEAGDSRRDVSHDGVARVRIELVKDLLSLDAGAIATHTRVDAGGAAPQFNSPNAANLTQVYAAYASPSLAHAFGEANVAASYRYGYVVTDGSSAAPAAGVPRADRFESSMSHQADLSLGMKRSSLPFDWTVRGQYQQERASQLARHYETINGSAEVVLPVTGTIAVVASGGYEKTQTSERKALLDANGAPVLTGKGGFVVDPTSPRTLTYDVSGFIGDGGVIWRPSHHTRLEARAGYRYGGFTTSGIFEYQPSARSGLTLIVFDRIDSFGRGITDGLAASSPSFDPTSVNGATNPYQTCLFGKEKGTGSCIRGSLSSASASTYRSRGANFIYSYQLRRTALSVSAGYTRRTYIDDPNAPVSLDGVVDEAWYFQGSIGRQLTPDSGINFAFSGDLFKNGQAGAPDVTSVALNGAYFRTFGKGLRAQALVGIEASKQDGVATDVSGRAQLGMRYQF